MIALESLLSKMKPRTWNGRPTVTLTYAQSLDGSIAVRRGEPCPLSGAETRIMTHQLRAAHDCIVVGIGTVLADNPHLTVRLVEGANPVPIILDSHLSFPLDSNLLKNNVPPLIATTLEASSEKQRRLQERGATVVRLPPDERGWVDLASLLHILARYGFSSVMVEGGARVITSFLARRLVDRVIITITPLLLGGLHCVENPLGLQDKEDRRSMPTFANFGYEQMGSDMVFWGEFE